MEHLIDTKELEKRVFDCMNNEDSEVTSWVNVLANPKTFPMPSYTFEYMIDGVCHGGETWSKEQFEEYGMVKLTGYIVNEISKIINDVPSPY